MAHIILAGLETAAQESLGRVLSEQGHRVTVGWQTGLPAAGALFCNGDDPGYISLVHQVRTLRPNLPVIVVTGLPESGKWLDALEAGAADYCSAPFETVQICRLLTAVLAHAAFDTPNRDASNQVAAGTSNSQVLL